MKASLKHVPVGRRWGYTGMVVGFIASISFNMADAHMEKPGQLGPLLLAPQAPLILYVSLEILTRTEWKKGSKGVWAARVSVAGVALISGITSYLHLHNLLQEWDPGLPAVIFPLAIDLLMVGGAASLLASTDYADNQPVDQADSSSASRTSVESTEPEPNATSEQPAPRPGPPRRRVNGRDLRIVEARRLIETARANGQSDPSTNAVAKALGVKWDTAKTIRDRALDELTEATP